VRLSSLDKTLTFFVLLLKGAQGKGIATLRLEQGLLRCLEANSRARGLLFVSDYFSLLCVF